MIVHSCRYSSQPYVTIFCTQQEHYVWSQPTGLPDGVYMADPYEPEILADLLVTGPLYTFDESKVTCPECLGAAP